MPAANRSGVGAKRSHTCTSGDGDAQGKLWKIIMKIISPGKKAAASGTAGASSGASEPPIDDALRKAVAAAAARAQAKADAWLAAHQSL